MNGKTILVIDASSSCRTVVKLALQKAGYVVVEAVDGEDAVARLDTHPPALIVCDVNMPRMDGLSFARHVKTTTDHRFTPVIMLTTESQEAKKIEGRAAGACLDHQAVPALAARGRGGTAVSLTTQA
jgi:two-component system, chemotaxis family, chemotaxis protein CheY